jgi:PAS domain S-box-containing protein
MDDQGNAVSELEELTLALLHSRAEVERLREREQLFSSLLGSVNAALWAFDWDAQRVIYVSPAYERIFGRSAALLLADYGEWRNSIYPDDVEYAAESLAKVLETGAVEFREYRIIRADGQLRWLSDKCFVSPRPGSAQGKVIVGIAEDITEKKRLEGELHRLATTDVLTQSSNRRHFFECARREFEHARQYGSPLAFLLLDLDDFKKINDQYGHQLGDQVLQRLAQCQRVAPRRPVRPHRRRGIRRAVPRLRAGYRPAGGRASAARGAAPELPARRHKLRHHRQPGADQPARRRRQPGGAVRPCRRGHVPGQAPGQEPDRAGLRRWRFSA